MDNNKGISIFQRYLTVWVILCMIAGVLIGQFLPQIPTFLGHFEYANVSVPMAILIWLMIYPMMMKVDFQSIKNVGKNPKGLFVTWVTNWLIKPFTMYGIASALSGAMIHSYSVSVRTAVLSPPIISVAVLLSIRPICLLSTFSDAMFLL